METGRKNSRHPASTQQARAVNGKAKPTTGKRVGKSKPAKANNQLNRRVK